MAELIKYSFNFKIRFSEIDAMRVVWHGAYVKYFEDAREMFGEKFNLSYKMMEEHGYYAPIVDLSIQYKKPLRYDTEAEITIIYHPTEAAKIVFDYEIKDRNNGDLIAIGHSIQVFINHKYELVLQNPPFYEEWKKENVIR